MPRRRWVLAVGLGLVALIGSYAVYTQRVVSQLRSEASRSGRMYAQVYRALTDTASDANATLFDLSRHIRQSGVPVVVTNDRGIPTAWANLPFENTDPGDPRLRDYIRELDRENLPVSEPGIGTVHFGFTPLVRGLRIIPLLYGGMLVLLLGTGLYLLRVRDLAERERVWAGMAREAAHQLGTPLSSMSGWVELLQDRDNDPMIASAIMHMAGDLDRLDRVARRFERIGRPPKRESIDVCAMVERIAQYFRSRVPTLAHSVAIASACEDGPVEIEGDVVLLEWALESLVKNAVDALAGHGGRILVSAARRPGGDVAIRVADDGPGIPRELRTRIFEAGFSTKDRGWGIGLSLARRIVEQSHGGRLVLVPSGRGAVFDIILS